MKTQEPNSLTTGCRNTHTPTIATQLHQNFSHFLSADLFPSLPQIKSRYQACFIKALLLALVMAFPFESAHADKYRTWTEEATKRTIEAKIVDKDDEAGTVSVFLKNMKRVKLDVAKLTEEDQRYVESWSKSILPENQLTVRIVASGRSRGKRVEVDVVAGKSDVTVSGHRLNATVKAGERELFQVEVPNKYTFTLHDADGNLVDQETALKKTGKTESR